MSVDPWLMTGAQYRDGNVHHCPDLDVSGQRLPLLDAVPAGRRLQPLTRGPQDASPLLSTLPSMLLPRFQGIWDI